jgi:aspartate racemase
MTAMDFIARLRALDVQLWLEDDRLRCSAPAGVLSSELRVQLKDRKEELVSFLQYAGQSFTDLSPHQTSGLAQKKLLSFSQQRLWFLDQMEPGNPNYNIWGLLWINGALNVSALERAIVEIIRRHDSLRTAFISKDGEPSYVIGGMDAWRLGTIDLTALRLEEGKKEVVRLATIEGRRPFDLTQSSSFRVILMRCAESVSGLFLCVHHIVSDTLSFGVFIKELAALYEAFLAGKTSPLPALPLQYSDFVRWQRERWDRGEMVEQLNYWKRQLGGKLPVLELPADHGRLPMQTFHGSRHSMMLSRALTEALREIGHRERSTLFMTLLAAFKALLCRYTGLEDVLVGTPVSGRSRPEDELLFGFFVNILVLRTDLSGNPTFRELLARIRDVALNAYANDEVPFDQLVEVLRPERTTRHSPIFQVMFTMQPLPVRSIELGSATLIPDEDIDPGTARYDLAVDVVEKDGGLKIYFEYNTSLFEEAPIRRFEGHFEKLLESIVANPDQRITELQLLTEGEREQVLVEWNSTRSDYPTDLCVHQLIQVQASKTPERVAVQFGEVEWTYAELEARADRLAVQLQQLGVGPEVLVGVCLERSPLMMLAVLATLKAGGAYVPLDPAFPRERLDFMVQDAQVTVLLTQEHLTEALATAGLHIVCLDAAGLMPGAGGTERPVSKVTPDNLAYVIYTSGSTGTPKGVQITHRSLVNCLVSLRRQPGLTEQDRLLAVTTLSFDIAGVELYLPLLAGARIVLASRAVATDAGRLAALLDQSGATVMQATPATWQMLLAAGWEGTRGLKMLCGGEALSRDLADQLLARGASLWNLYGPTETTIWSTLAQVDHGAHPVSIGCPIANTQVYVLDPHRQPVPIGVVGELWVGGAGLARGYLNRPELTQEKFIADPFRPSPAARLYRTGDLARYRPDGMLECLGRADQQVKIRGFRIELGEIETILAQHPDLRGATVTVRENHRGERELAAFVIPTRNPAPSASTLRHFLKGKLPAYMIPTHFVEMSSFPLSPNGKVDRSALMRWEGISLSTVTEAENPTNLTEVRMLAVWQRVLNRKDIGLRDDFFEVGGHSLLAAELCAEIQRKFNRHLSLSTLFNARTPREMAAVLSEQQHLAPSQLLPFRTGGAKPPFFSVHFGGGRLAHYVEDDQPWYGLHLPSWDGLRNPRTVEATAAEYLRRIRTLQPEGPYFLGGYSFGGVVAFEMAHQLHRQEQEVALLVLVVPTDLCRVIRGQPTLIQYLKGLGRKMVWMAGELSLAMGRRIPPRLRQHYTNETSLQAMGTYVPQTYPGRLVLFQLTENGADVQNIWGSLAADGFEWYEVPGDHFTLLEEPHVHVFLRRLWACLQQAQARVHTRSVSI